VLDYFFTVVFLIEAIIKILALGFFFNRIPGVGAYISSPWNILDFIVVLASLVDVFITIVLQGKVSSGNANAIRGIRSLRVLRAFRPLRMI